MGHASGISTYDAYDSEVPDEVIADLLQDVFVIDGK